MAPWYRRRGWDGYGDFYPRSRPRAAKGGIKSQSRRGNFGESWWAKRWIEVLEGFQLGGRLSRGRSYARQGQVVSIDIAKGSVTASVQGSRPSPYQVTIRLKPLSGDAWRLVAAQLSQQALFSAKLLAGEMPQELEDIFRAAKLSLFPARAKDLATDCSCPDWSNPCKHIAAVYYLIGEQFDKDPFLLLRLRGIERQELLKLVGASRGSEPETASAEAPATAPDGKPRRRTRSALKAEARSSDEEKPRRNLRRSAGKADTRVALAAADRPNGESSAIAPPLPCDPHTFWEGKEVGDAVFGAVQMPSGSAGLVKRLGSLPFWRGQQRMIEWMESVYSAASPVGMDAFLGKMSGEEISNLSE